MTWIPYSQPIYIIPFLDNNPFYSSFLFTQLNMSNENLIMSSVNGVSAIRPEIALNGLANGIKVHHELTNGHGHDGHKHSVAIE